MTLTGDHTENSFRRVIMPKPQLLWIGETYESLLVHEMMGEGELQEVKERVRVPSSKVSDLPRGKCVGLKSARGRLIIVVLRKKIFECYFLPSFCSKFFSLS